MHHILYFITPAIVRRLPTNRVVDTERRRKFVFIEPGRSKLLIIK